jgi:hypothetical protein
MPVTNEFREYPVSSVSTSRVPSEFDVALWALQPLAVWPTEYQQNPGH